MFMFPKPKPRALVKAQRKSELDAIDRRERKLCKLRSGGRCEVVIVTPKPETSTLRVDRCKAKAVNNHHLLGGHGRRNVGDSILAAHRIDTCQHHHSLLHAKALLPIDRDWQYDAALVRFEQVIR